MFEGVFQEKTLTNDEGLKGEQSVGELEYFSEQ